MNIENILIHNIKLKISFQNQYNHTKNTVIIANIESVVINTIFYSLFSKLDSVICHQI